MKTSIIAGVIMAAVLSGCGGGSSYSSTNSTAYNASTSVITVLSATSVPLSGVAVTISTDLNGSSPAGTIIGTRSTNGSGQAGFANLPSTGQLCASATMGGSTVGTCAQPFPVGETLMF